MNLPGFTAEASLYRTSECYRAIAGISNVWLDGGKVGPQSLALLKCLQGCHDADSPDYCQQHCYWNEAIEGGGGGGGGGGQSCAPGCGECYSDLDSPTGGFKSCVKHDCTTYNLTCRTRPRGGRSSPTVEDLL